jgi:hypothetical protein
LPRQLLANLWARQAILQCCHNQQSLDCLFPVYFGSVSPNANFDPSLLSGGVDQIKFKANTDTKAEIALRPIGIPRDLNRPLPYLALLMELGNESLHRATHSKIKSSVSQPLSDDGFQRLVEDWMAAVKRLKRCKSGSPTKSRIEELKGDVEAKRLAMDSYNRYLISARGSSPDVYGILNKADIAEQFATLLQIVMPMPTDQDSAIQHMQPLEHLGDTSHTAWMKKYVVVESENMVGLGLGDLIGDTGTIAYSG